jgi:FAD/FMN-containing dehydrogenase
MLRHLFIGAEGTLGIITGAALRLHPQTPNTAHAWVATADPAAAVALLAALQDRAGSYIQAFELVSGAQLELVRKHAERARFPFSDIPAWSVLIELGSEDATTALPSILEEVVGAALENGAVLDAVIAKSEQQAAEFWHIRHSVSEANQREGISVTHDVAVRSSDVAPFIAAANSVAAERYPEAATLVVCHLGDGNVHYILLFQRELWTALPDPEAFALEVERAVHDVAARFGGTFSAEHGVGRKLTEELARLADPLRYELMNKVKTLFDPQNLVNPGVLLAKKD